jgi:hypothetical protein
MESAEGTQCGCFEEPMSELRDVASGVAPVSPYEDAPDGCSGEHASNAAPGGKQTGTFGEVENVGRRALGDATRDQLDDNLSASKENVGRLADEQKNAGAQRISGLARAVHGAANNLEPDWPQAAQPLHDAAAALERASTALRERSVVDLMDGVGKFAHAQPVAFFGGTVLAGLVLARFLKSSTEPRPTTANHE